MLTKSQARAFFLGGTLLFGGIFIFLTVDTLGQMKERTNTEELTAEVAAGKELWDDSNCMGCHTLLGEGGYYAPELTTVYQRRGPEWIKLFMKDPEAMYPGERKMVKYDFTEEQLDQVVAFFKWIGKIDTNGFPPEPDIVSPGNIKPQETVAGASSAPEKYSQMCVACHSVGAQGGTFGPALDGVASRLDRAYLDSWLQNPAAIKADTNMPKIPLTDAERQSIVDYLSTLK